MVFEPRSDPYVEVLSILPDNHEINIMGCLAGKRGLNPVKQPDRAKVDIHIEMEAECEEYSFLQDPRFYPLVTDGPKVDRPELRELLQFIFGDEFS